MNPNTNINIHEDNWFNNTWKKKKQNFLNKKINN